MQKMSCITPINYRKTRDCKSQLNTSPFCSVVYNVLKRVFKSSSDTQKTISARAVHSLFGALGGIIEASATTARSMTVRSEKYILKLPLTQNPYKISADKLISQNLRAKEEKRKL